MPASEKTCGGQSAHPKGECHERTSNDDFGERAARRQPAGYWCPSPRRRRWRWRRWRWRWPRRRWRLWWRHGRPRRRPRRWPWRRSNGAWRPRALWRWTAPLRWRRLRPQLPVLSVLHIQLSVLLRLLNVGRSEADERAAFDLFMGSPGRIGEKQNASSTG